MNKWIKYRTEDGKIYLENFERFTVTEKFCHINGRFILKEDFEKWEPNIIKFVSSSNATFLDLVNLSMIVEI